MATVYVDSSTVRTKSKRSYTRHLLRTSFREHGKVKHKTIANLSGSTDEEIAAIKLALKHKKDLSVLGSGSKVKAVLGKRIGAVWALYVLAERLQIQKALGTERNGKLALLQVIARTIDQGSRLSAVRFAKSHAVCEVLGIRQLDEDDLYENLAWLAEHQESIEKELFALRFQESTPTLFLYDVTSSYLEGMCNELGTWGYNRDGKKGKQQIVVGLLADPDGLPVAVRVFQGNTTDTKTVSEQVRIVAEGFGVKQVTLVGDRGMLKGPQIDSLPDGFRYITAITKSQIRKMLTDGVLQYELFNSHVCEVDLAGIRYILRRNPLRAKQIAATRQSKLASIRRLAEERTRYLANHPRADAEKAREKVTARIKKLKADAWLSATQHDRTIRVDKDEAALAEVALLDGCYAIKSDVPKDDADAQTLHDRYCDLENVERSFRTMKTAHLEMRPVFVHKEQSTRGHAFVVMLALLLQRELEKCWRHLDVTVEEGIDELAAIHMQQLHLGSTPINNIPSPNEIGQQLLEKAAIQLPSVLPGYSANVHTKKKLPSERKAS